MAIELPFPAKILWPNGRAHWRDKNRAFQKHKQWAYYAMLERGVRASIVTDVRITWSVIVHPKTRHEIDDDNARASLKAYQDGFAQALGVNDSRFAAPALSFGEPVKGGKIVVEFARS